MWRCNILLVGDQHFITNKLRVQEESAHNYKINNTISKQLKENEIKSLLWSRALIINNTYRWRCSDFVWSIII